MPEQIIDPEDQPTKADQRQYRCESFEHGRQHIRAILEPSFIGDPAESYLNIAPGHYKSGRALDRLALTPALSRREEAFAAFVCEGPRHRARAARFHRARFG